MRYDIGAVVAQSAMRFSAAALGMTSRRIWRRHEAAPLSPEAASDVVAQLIRDIQTEVAGGTSTAIAVCCALEATLDARREQVTSLLYAPGWDGVRFQK